MENDGGQIDMLPTLLYLLGTDQTLYQDTVMGRNLLGPHSGSPITAEGELVASADDEEILEEAQAIANYAIMGNYHKRILHE